MKKIYWANVREQANQMSYIELEQISKNRWKVTLGIQEYIIRTSSTDFFEVLEVALKDRPRQNP